MWLAWTARSTCTVSVLGAQTKHSGTLLSWKDSVNVPKHSKVRIIVKLEHFPGKWMYHCHILDHEDMGMMGILEVR
jgi:FtsP/CotA-like multicopper oxidase with cupredoxin domain